MSDALAAEPAVPFASTTQQRDAAHLGMWIFLATEVLFFGAMFLAYTVYRYLYPAGFEAAALHMDRGLGTINTGILLTSSLTAALAVREARLGRLRQLGVFDAGDESHALDIAEMLMDQLLGFLVGIQEQGDLVPYRQILGLAQILDRADEVADHPLPAQPFRDGGVEERVGADRHAGSGCERTWRRG